MKNYKLLAPVILIALFVLGIYMTGSNNVKDENQYSRYLEEARNFASQEIEVYALENYQSALEMRPSLGLYLEIASFYRDTIGNVDKAKDWGETALRNYPKVPEPYEFLMGIYLDTHDYMAFFELYNNMLNRHVASQVAEEFFQTVEYEYYLQGEFDEVLAFSSNLAPIRRNENWGYSNSRGKKKIGTIYTYAGAFNNGMAPVIDAEGNAFFIDNNGNRIFVPDIEGEITELGVMSSVDIYAVKNGSEWNYYNKSGDLVMGGFSEVTTLANGVAACKTGDSWKIYDASGNVQNNDSYDAVLTDEKGMAYRNGCLFVRSGEACKMIDVSGTQIGDTYEDAKTFYDTTYAAVKKGGKWGFVDKEGNWFIEPMYEDARSFSNGFAAVQKEGQWGFINMDREICIPCQFTDAKDFTANGTVLVKENMTWSVLLLYQKNY